MNCPTCDSDDVIPDKPIILLGVMLFPTYICGNCDNQWYEELRK